MQLPETSENTPRYGQALRALGNCLDLQEARYLVLEQRAAELFWRFTPLAGHGRIEQGQSSIAALAALDTSYGQTMRSRRKGLRDRLRPHRATAPLPWHPLLPEGYSGVLRALGTALDRRRMRLLGIEEGEDWLALRYSLAGTGWRLNGPPPPRADALALYRRDQLLALLGAASGLRGRAG